MQTVVSGYLSELSRRIYGLAGESRKAWFLVLSMALTGSHSDIHINGLSMVLVPRPCFSCFLCFLFLFGRQSASGEGSNLAKAEKHYLSAPSPTT